jgi:hypothetical protein
MPERWNADPNAFQVGEPVRQAGQRSRFSSAKRRRASIAISAPKNAPAISAPKNAPILEMIYSRAVPAAFLYIRRRLDRERSRNRLTH